MPMLVLGVLLLSVAAFAQWSIPRFTRRSRDAWALRLLLLALGIAVGTTLAGVSGGGGDAAFALFLVGFGLVHVPPAVVLLLKRWRRESPS